MRSRWTIVVVMGCLGGVLAGCPSLEGEWIGECDLGEVDGHEWVWDLDLTVEGDKGDAIRGYAFMQDNTIYETSFSDIYGERDFDAAHVELRSYLTGIPVTMDLDGVIEGNLLTGDCSFDWGEEYSVIGDLVLTR